MADIPLDFYVYALADPRCGSVFYVGKGKGDRAWQHQRDFAKGKAVNSAKTRRIFEITEAGFDVEVRILREYELEADAFEHEIELIASLPGLTNIGRGGEGACPVISPEELERRITDRIARARQRRKDALSRAGGTETCRIANGILRSAKGRITDDVVLWMIQNTDNLRKRPLTKRQGVRQSKAALASFRAAKPS